MHIQMMCQKLILRMKEIINAGPLILWLSLHDHHPGGNKVSDLEGYCIWKVLRMAGIALVIGDAR